MAKDHIELGRDLRRRGIKPGALRTDLRASLIQEMQDNEELRAENEMLREKLKQKGEHVPPPRPKPRPPKR